MNILIVEDTTEVSTLLKNAIEKWGYSAAVTETGQSAVEIIRKEMFDLILLDIFLPDVVAYDLIPQLKQEWSGINIITMTGYSSRELEEKVRSHGVLYYMEKPIDLVELKSIIDHLNRKK